MGNPQRNQGSGRLDAVSMATLGGVIVVLLLSITNGRDLDRVEKSLDSRLGQIESRLAQVSEKVSQAAARASRPTSGPDPVRVYPIKIAGAAINGPESAPVTIAEFSDFQ